MAIGDIVQARIVTSLHGQTCMNGFHYVVQQGLQTVPNFASVFESAILGLFQQCLSNEASITRCDYNTIWPLPRTFTYTIAHALDGAGPTPSCPSSVAAVVTKNTDLAGRKYRGRIYIPGVPASWESGSILNPFPLETYTDLAIAMTTDLSWQGTSGWKPCIFHAADAAAGKAAFSLLTTCIARSILRNQRRRQVGRGI